MLKRKSKEILQEEAGSGLVLTLMVLLVLSVLGATVGVVTIGSLQLSTVNRDTNSAYYIAEAGANKVYEGFKGIVHGAYGDYNAPGEETSFYQRIKTEKNRKEFNQGKSYEDYAMQFGNTPTAFVKIESEIDGEYTIISTGDVGGKERTVKKDIRISWVPKKVSSNIPLFTIPEIPVNAAVIVTESIDNKEDGVVIGDIHTSIADDWEFDKDWEVPDIPTETQSKVDWTEYNRYKKKLKEKGDQDINLSNLPKPLKGSYQKEKLVLNKDYTFEVGDNDVTIFVDKLEMKSSTITVVGKGSLTIVVDDDIQINSGSKVEANMVSAKNVYIKDGGKVVGDIFAEDDDVIVELGGSVIGNVYAKDDVIVKGIIKGNITSGDDVDISGTVIGNIQLKDDVIVSGTVTGNIFSKDEVKIIGTVTGNIIGKDIIVDGKVTGDLISRDDIEVSGEVIGHMIAKDEVKISGSITGDIIAKDDVDIKSTGKVYGNIISGDDVTLEKSAEVIGVIFAKNDVKIKKNAEVLGSVISKDIENSGTITYIKQGVSEGEDLITSEPVIEVD